MSEKQNYKSSEDEIDLRQLFNVIGSFFSKLWATFIQSIVIFRRATLKNKYLIIFISILVCILSVIRNNFSDPIYSSSLLLSSEYFNGRIIDNSIEKLNLLCAETDKLGLSKELGLDQEVASNIVEFSAIPFISEDDRVEIEVLKQKLQEMDLEEVEISEIISRIDIENKNAFQINVSVTKSEIIEGIESALVNYFRNNDYIKKRVISRENYLKERIAKLQKESLKMDSLKTAMIKVLENLSRNNPKGSDNLYIGEQNPSDPVAIYREGLRINSEIITLKQELELKKDFELIDGLTVYRKPISASRFKSGVYGFLVGIAISYILIMLISINRYLTKVESEMTA